MQAEEQDYAYIMERDSLQAAMEGFTSTSTSTIRKSVSQEAIAQLVRSPSQLRRSLTSDPFQTEQLREVTNLSRMKQTALKSSDGRVEARGDTSMAIFMQPNAASSQAIAAICEEPAESIL